MKEISCTYAKFQQICVEKGIKDSSCRLDIFLSGYSRGAIAALEIAKKLEKYGDRLLVHLELIDPVTYTGSGDGLRISPYISSAVSYYQQNPKRCKDGPFIGMPLLKAPNTDNVLVEGTDHCDIPYSASPMVIRHMNQIIDGICVPL